MKEYSFEDGRKVNISNLQADFLNKEDYAKAHEHLVIPCHDVFIRYKEGILLIVRDNLPGKDIFWPIGGRISRGIETIESLRKKVKSECNLELENISELGTFRIYWNTEPFGHGHGTDNVSFVYIADGIGELKLDNLHKDPRIVTKEEYSKIRDSLHPFVRDFMDKAWGNF